MQYRHIGIGLQHELAAITPEQSLLHLRNYIGNFLLDPAVAASYINKLGNLQPEVLTPDIQRWLRYLITKYAELRPFDENAATLAANLMGTDTEKLRQLQKCRLPAAMARKVEALSQETNADKTRATLCALLRDFRYATDIVEQLIACDLDLGLPIGTDWLDIVALPPSLQPLLMRRVCQCNIMLGNIENALSMLSQIAPSDGPQWLNHLAELHMRTGEKDKALGLYTRSLEQDPLQLPVQYRMEAIDNPERDIPDALSANISIFLYSWNKADLLASTLRSLATSETGSAHITVLLNGCTDDSAAQVSALNEQLFNGRIHVVSLPINIGAPAARNWLLATDQGRTADYVAFLDDDVEVPPNWLRSMLSVLRRRPRAGVIGIKTLNPGNPRRIQYLYRNIAVAIPGLIRISLDTPNTNFDVGFYDVTRTTANVMGCCHIFTRKALDAVPTFDLRFSPSQMDDIAHDIDVALAGFEVIFFGGITCIHHQMSGLGRNQNAINFNRLGNVAGNDVKFYYRFADKLEALGKLNNLDRIPTVPPHC